MATRMNLKQFKQFATENNISRIIMDAEDQPELGISFLPGYHFSFSTLQFANNPDIMCLCGMENKLYFTHIKYINVDAEETVFGTVLEVCCGNEKDDIKYTLIAS